MKTKKVLTLLIAMTLTLGMFTGCATKPSGNATEKPK